MCDRYRLPCGRTTGDSRHYCDEWNVLAEAIEGLMPGWVLYAYDPGLVFMHNGHTYNVPVPLAVAIAKSQKEGAADV